MIQGKFILLVACGIILTAPILGIDVSARSGDKQAVAGAAYIVKPVFRHDSIHSDLIFVSQNFIILEYIVPMIPEITVAFFHVYISKQGCYVHVRASFIKL